MTLEERRKKLVFRAWHRGTREMDLLMGSFADSYVQGFGPAELDAFEHMLSCPDPDLYDWKCGLSQPDANDDSDVLRLFIAHQFAGS